MELPRDPTGKRRQKSVTVRGTKKEAEKVLAELITQVEQRSFVSAPARLKTGDFLNQWLEAVRPHLKPGTAISYLTNVLRLQKVLGNVELGKLTVLGVQTAIGSLPTDLAPRSRRETFNTLRTALRQAVAWGLIPKDPTAGVKPPPRGRREMSVWIEEQLIEFLGSAHCSRYWTLFRVAAATGMRLGEILGLSWDDVDLVNGAIHVRRSLSAESSVRKPVFQDPKTPSSRRRVPLDRETIEALRRHRARQAEDRLRWGPVWQDYGLVFCSRKGLAIRHADVSHRFRRLVERLGLPLIRFHDLRHTHATILLRRGVHPKVVSERLGHSRVGITLDVYSHVLPDTQAQAVQAVEVALGEAPGQGRKTKTRLANVSNFANWKHRPARKP